MSVRRCKTSSESNFEILCTSLDLPCIECLLRERHSRYYTRGSAIQHVLVVGRMLNLHTSFLQFSLSLVR